jgi:hypothetical protein
MVEIGASKITKSEIVIMLPAVATAPATGFVVCAAIAPKPSNV